MFDNTFRNRVVYKLLCALLLPVCALIWRWTPSAANGVQGREQGAAGLAAEIPAEWNGQPLRPLALSDVEQRFAAHFPGTLARMTDGTQVLVLRTVQQPTRMLHPAIDCYRALGYRIAAQKLALDAQHRLWRCFEAQRTDRSLRVCERIVAADGSSFTDTSSWYWSAALGQSSGPWQAITVASPQ